MDLCFLSSEALDYRDSWGYHLVSKFVCDNYGNHLFVVTEGNCHGLDAIDLEWYRMWARSENNYNKNAMEWLDDWNRRTKFSKSLMYGNFSIWWLERFAFHDWLSKFLIDLDSVDKIISEKKPTHIFAIWLDIYWLDLLRMISDKYDIGVTVIDRDSLRKRTKKVVYFVRVARCLQGSLRLLRHRISSSICSKPRVFVRTSSLVCQRVH